MTVKENKRNGKLTVFPAFNFLFPAGKSFFYKAHTVESSNNIQKLIKVYNKNDFIIWGKMIRPQQCLFLKNRNPKLLILKVA